MTNENGIPLAYFITFRTYASWLHGDDRTSVDRTNNRFNTPKIAPNPCLHRSMYDAQKQETVTLNKRHGDIILDAAAHVCDKNNWKIHALHVRTNHVHATITSERTPEHVMQQLKAHATRFLRIHKEFSKDKKIWSRHGSTEYLWLPKDLYFSSEYTIEKQGRKMAYYFDEQPYIDAVI
ncbi:MAG: transposase [Gammaproteobacteria bacterium]|nr:transposase [Gammaproteobacteria bacterium]